MMVGVSGSGKSTWREEFMEKNLKYFLVNGDSLRRSVMGTLEGYYQRMDLNTIEKAVNELQDSILSSAAWSNYNVIVDNPNLTQKYINYFITHPSVTSYKFKLMDCNPVVAKTRVAKRDFEDFMQVDDRLIENLAYIDKQDDQYQNIKQWILQNHADKIIQ